MTPAANPCFLLISGRKSPVLEISESIHMNDVADSTRSLTMTMSRGRSFLSSESAWSSVSSQAAQALLPPR